MMGTINHLTAPYKQTISRLVGIWESAVKKTHKFLSENDIIKIKLEACQGLKSIEKLYAYYDSNHIMQGFVGIINQKIEMLFINDDARGQGIGKLLVNYTINNLSVKRVDVNEQNEQNEQAVGFYNHMGVPCNQSV